MDYLSAKLDPEGNVVLHVTLLIKGWYDNVSRTWLFSNVIPSQLSFRSVQD